VRFDGLSIAYDARVLTPRPWTAMQSRWAAELVDRAPHPILELFAGAGHIGLAAARRSGHSLVQVDAEPVACAYAAENARLAGMGGRSVIRCGDIEHSIGDDEVYSVVIADPPYLSRDDVRRFPDDPVFAVDGGHDGLIPARRCLDLLARRLGSGTRVLLQLCGRRQVDQIVAERSPAVRLRDVRTDGPDRAVALFETAGYQQHRHGVHEV
jgi:methylase of polypeptide subunit release factors